MFSLNCVWINGLVNNREAGDLRRYRAHYDVTVMRNQDDSALLQIMFTRTFAVLELSHENSCLATKRTLDKYSKRGHNKFRNTQGPYRRSHRPLVSMTSAPLWVLSARLPKGPPGISSPTTVGWSNADYQAIISLSGVSLSQMVLWRSHGGWPRRRSISCEWRCRYKPEGNIHLSKGQRFWGVHSWYLVVTFLETNHEKHLGASEVGVLKFRSLISPLREIMIY